MLLVELPRVEDEHKKRIGFRDNLLYATLAVAADVIAVVAQRAALLLALPQVGVARMVLCRGRRERLPCGHLAQAGDAG
ncbi:hypothetical protein ACWCQQ_21880 [Streptomyces sp. NPDC002143]